MWEIFTKGTGDVKGSSDPISIVLRGANILLYVVGIAAVVMVIVGGLMYALSAGDERRAATARKIITGSLIGLGIALLSGALVSFAMNVLG